MELRIDYTDDELALYENEGSAYNWLNVISCTLFVINPIFDWLYAFFNAPGYTTTLQGSRMLQYLDTFAWGFWCPLYVMHGALSFSSRHWRYAQIPTPTATNLLTMARCTL